LNYPVIDVIIPALNEEKSIAKVINDLPDEWVREVIVCDNNSTDRTAHVAQGAGATVVAATRPGYGSACLQGIAHINGKDEPPDIVVFIDGDYSDYPEEIVSLVQPILHDGAEFVIGSRALGQSEKGSMTIPQVFGNWLATTLIRVIYRYTFTDLGPFRAITWSALQSLDMRDKDYGWTVEMQVKAAKKGLVSAEVPVRYRRRIGKSKVSGTIKGTFLAGQKILWTIFNNI